MTVYLDTSGLNYLSDNISDELMSNLRKLGFKFYISSITLWEILLNSNDKRREELIYWGQINCENQLLKSPSEILVEYLNDDCPEKNRTKFWQSPYTKLDIGTTWKNIHGDSSRTIPVNASELKDFTRVNHDLSKKFRTILSSMLDVDYEKKETDYFYLSAKTVATKLDFPWESKYQSHFIIATIIAFFVLCTGMELDKSVIRKYWNVQGVDDPFDRLEYLIANHPIFFKRGPIAEMTFMIETQISMQNSKSRGLLHDCFHLIYAYFADTMITNDNHFIKFREQINHVAFNRILIVDEIEKLFESFSG